MSERVTKDRVEEMRKAPRALRTAGFNNAGAKMRRESQSLNELRTILKELSGCGRRELHRETIKRIRGML